MERSHITKLDLARNNFNEWQGQLKGILKAKHIFKYVTGEIPKPISSFPPTAEQLTSLADWEYKDEEAQGYILQCITSGDYRAITEAVSSKDMMDILTRRHRPSLSSLIPLKRQALINLQKAPSAQMEKFIEEFKLKMRDFEDVGGFMNELEKCRTFLTCLQSRDPSWTQFSSSKITREYVTNFSNEKVANPLLLEDLFLDAQEASNILRPKSYESEANFVEPISQKTPAGSAPQQKASQCSPGLQCNTCGGRGHTSRFCYSLRDSNWKIVKNAVWEKVNPDKPAATKSQWKRRGPASSGSYSDNPSAHVAESNHAFDPYSEAYHSSPISLDLATILDSGCTKSVIIDRSLIYNFVPCAPFSIITLGKSETDNDVTVEGRGDVCLRLGEHTWWIRDVLYVPNGRRNLISDPQISRHGHIIQRETNPLQWVISNQNGDRLASFVLSENNLYCLTDAVFVHPVSANYAHAKKETDVVIWHARLGHPSMARHRLIPNIPCAGDMMCDACSLSKMKSLPHAITNTKLKYQPGELVVGDYKWVNNAQLNGEGCGFFLLMDVATAYNALYAVRGKDESLSAFLKFESFSKSQKGISIKSFRHDRGKEYLNKEFQDHLVSSGILDQSTAGYSPESNSLAESRFRVLEQITTSLLAQANLSTLFFKHAFLTASYIHNRMPDSKGHVPFTSFFWEATFV